MKAISKIEGRKLIQEGRAGWYAANANLLTLFKWWYMLAAISILPLPKK